MAVKPAILGKTVALIGGAAGVAFLASKLLKGNSDTVEVTDPVTSQKVTVTKTSSSAGSTAKWSSGKFPLRQGMYNNYNVLWLQKALIAAGVLAKGGDDGDFGPMTRDALRAAKVNPDNGVSTDTYNGFMLKYGLNNYIVLLTGEYKSSVNATTPVASVSSGTTSSTGNLSTGKTLDVAMARFRILNEPTFYVNLSDALNFINWYVGNVNDYNRISAEVVKTTGLSLYNAFLRWNWSASSLQSIIAAFKGKGISNLSGLGTMRGINDSSNLMR